MKIFLLLLLLLLSCKEKKRFTKKVNNVERFEYFKKNIDTVLSKKIEKLINDTIDRWISKNLRYFQLNMRKYIKSSLSKYIFFNSKKDKLVARLVMQCLENDCLVDQVYSILGNKIDSTWWFYQGEAYSFPREYVTKEIHKPIPFEKLEEIGINNTMNWYYYEKDTTFCNLPDHLDFANNKHKCKKRILIINDNYFNSIDWECEHEHYVDYHYEKKYEDKVNDSSNK